MTRMSTLSAITILRNCAALGLGLHRKAQLHSCSFVNIPRHGDPKVVEIRLLLWCNDGYNLPEAIVLTLPGSLACCWRCNGVQEVQEGEIPSWPRSIRSALSQGIFGKTEASVKYSLCTQLSQQFFITIVFMLTANCFLYSYFFVCSHYCFSAMHCLLSPPLVMPRKRPLSPT